MVLAGSSLASRTQHTTNPGYRPEQALFNEVWAARLLGVAKRNNHTHEVIRRSLDPASNYYTVRETPRERYSVTATFMYEMLYSCCIQTEIKILNLKPAPSSSSS